MIYKEMAIKAVSWVLAVIVLGLVCKVNYYLFMLGWEVL